MRWCNFGLLIAVFAFSLLGCIAKEDSTLQDTRPLVLVTVAPYAYLIQELGGNFVRILNLSEGNEDPHQLSIKPQAAILLKQAAVFLSLNPQEEQMVLEALSGDTMVVSLAGGLDLLPARQDHSEEHEKHKEAEVVTWDEHFWLSPRELLLQLPILHNSLLNLLPQQVEELAKRRDVLQQRLLNLEAKLQKELVDLKGAKLLSYHDSLAYLARLIGFTPLYVETEGLAINSQELLFLQKEVVNLSHKVLLVAPQYQQDNARAVAKMLNLKIIMFDPLVANIFTNLENVSQELLSIR